MGRGRAPPGPLRSCSWAATTCSTTRRSWAGPVEGNVHFGRHGDAASGPFRRHLGRAGRLSAFVGRVHRPLAVRRSGWDALSPMEDQRHEESAGSALVRATLSDGDGRGRQRAHETPHGRSGLGGRCDRGARPHGDVGALSALLLGQQFGTPQAMPSGWRAAAGPSGPAPSPGRNRSCPAMQTRSVPAENPSSPMRRGRRGSPFTRWLPTEVGYPHSRELYLRKLNLSGSRRWSNHLRDLCASAADLRQEGGRQRRGSGGVPRRCLDTRGGRRPRCDLGGGLLRGAHLRESR